MVSSSFLSWCWFDWFYYVYSSVLRRFDGLIVGCSQFFIGFLLLGYWCVISVNLPFVDKLGQAWPLLGFYAVPLAIWFFVAYFIKPGKLVDHMMPEGVGGGVSLFVAYTELFSIMVRPLVVILRITVNVTGGAILVGSFMAGLNYLDSGNIINCEGGWWENNNCQGVVALTGLLLLGLYEACVGTLHWWVVKLLHSLEMLSAERL